MDAKAPFSQLIDTLYEAATDPTLWALFLEQLSSVTRSTQAGILFHDFQHREHSVSVQWGVDPERLKAYAEYYGEHDIWVHDATPRLVEGSVMISEEVTPIHRLIASEFYNDYLRTVNTAHGLWAVVEKSPVRMTHLGLYRGLNDPEFASSELELVASIAPHVQRAFRLHLHLAELQARAAEVQAALDLVDWGILFLAQSGRVLDMNRAGRQMLKQQDGLRVCNGKLRTLTGAEDHILDRELTAALSPVSRSPVRAMSVSRVQKRPLQVMFVAAGKLAASAGSGAAITVIIVDASRPLRPPPEVLHALFGLTAAEARVALLLSDGHELSAIAEMLGVSANTLKSQLASVYAKTGYRRQSQIVRLVMGLGVAVKPAA